MKSLTWGALAVGTALTGASTAAVVHVLAKPPSDISDVAAFWRAGVWVADGRPGDLYPATSFGGTTGGAFKGFLNPPHVAALFSLGGHGSLRATAVAWALVNLGALGLLAVLGWRFLRARSISPTAAAALLALGCGSACVSTSFANGTSSLVVAAALGALVAADLRDDAVLGGVALGVLSWKPQYAIVPVVFLVLRRRSRIVVAGAIVSAATVAVSLPFTGLRPWGQYLPFLNRYASTLDIWRIDPAELWLPRQMLNLRALLIRSLGTGSIGTINALSTLALLGGVVVVAVHGRRVARRELDASLAWAAAAALMVVTSQHANVGDGAVLVIALALAMGAIASGRTRFAASTAERVLAAALALDLAVLLGNPSRVDPAVPWSALFAVALAGALLVACRRTRPTDAADAPDRAPTEAVTAPTRTAVAAGAPAS